MASAKRPQLGQILLQMGYLDQNQLQVALSHHLQWGMPLGQAVLERRFCTAEQVLQALAQQCGMPAVDLDRERMDPFLAQLIPQKIAELHRAVPLRVEGNRAEDLVIAIAAPATLASLDAIRAVSRKSRIVPYLASDDALGRAILRLHGGNPAPVEPPKPAAGTAADAEGLIHNVPMLDLSAPSTGPAPPAVKPPSQAPKAASPSATRAAIDAILTPPTSTSAAIDAILSPSPAARPPPATPAPAADPWAGDGWAELELTPGTKALIDQASAARGEARKATVAAILEAYAAFKKR